MNKFKKKPSIVKNKMKLVDLKKALSSELHLKATSNNHTKLAAVLVVIYGDVPKILMTKKSNGLKDHAGEISFPGGKLDKRDEDLLETALRETKEEINLEISREQVTGQLKPVTTLNSGFSITPFVAVLDELPSVQENFEVDSILHIPFLPFLQTFAPDNDPQHRSIQEMYTLTFKEYLVWGASARILKQILDILKKKQSA